MTFVDSEYDRIGAASERFDPALVTGEPLAIWAVSQLLRGSFEVLDRTVVRGDEYGQDSLTTRYGFTLECFANPDCPSVLNGELGGVLAGHLVAVNADGVPDGRGAHWGTFTWGRDSGVFGTINGVGNAGTHRPPLYEAVAFDQAGQLTGRLEGRFEHDVLGRCLLVASYVVDLDDPGGRAVAEATGVIEGAVLTGDAAS